MVLCQMDGNVKFLVTDSALFCRELLYGTGNGFKLIYLSSYCKNGNPVGHPPTKKNIKIQIELGESLPPT